MTLALELARRINALAFEGLPSDVVHWARIGILDTVGVTLAGSSEPATQIVRRTLARGSGSSVLFGSSRRARPLDAALVNGTASHALDFDDCNNTLGGHPSVPILPAIFALADETGCSGKDFIAAYVAGFETECKLAMGDGMYQYTRGWHPTTTLGIFGTAAACASLLKLTDEQTATALAIAASFAAGIKANFGSMTKPLHIGHCARDGLSAALLAREGFTANLAALEGRQGFFEVFNGAGNYDAGKILPAWGAPFDIVEPGIATKQHPCCGSTHPPIDALLMLAREHDLRAESVRRIKAWIHPSCLQHTDRPGPPKNGSDARFSLQYCLARALVARKLTLEHFEGDACREPAVLKLMERVEVAPYTAAQFSLDNYFGAEVVVTRDDGRELAAKVEEPVGCTSRNPLPANVLNDKFVGCAGRALPHDDVVRLQEVLHRFEEIPDVRELTALLAGPADERL